MSDVIYDWKYTRKMKIRNLIWWSFIFQWCVIKKKNPSRARKTSGVTVAILHNMTWGAAAAAAQPLSRLSRHRPGPDFPVYSHAGKKLHSTVDCQSWACHTRTRQPPPIDNPCRYLVTSPRLIITIHVSKCRASLLTGMAVNLDFAP